MRKGSVAIFTQGITLPEREEGIYSVTHWTQRWFSTNGVSYWKLEVRSHVMSCQAASGPARESLLMSLSWRTQSWRALAKSAYCFSGGRPQPLPLNHLRPLSTAAGGVSSTRTALAQIFTTSSVGGIYVDMSEMDKTIITIHSAFPTPGPSTI